MIFGRGPVAGFLDPSAFSKAEELKKRLWFTLGALIVYRLGHYIPLPGISPQAVFDVLNSRPSVVGRMSIFALGVWPYILAFIFVEVLTMAFPTLQQRKRAGEHGRRQVNQIARVGTVLLAALQAYGIAIGLEVSRSSVGGVVVEPGWYFRISTVITLVGGTMFLMWLGERITIRGVGNGIWLLFVAGLMADPGFGMLLDLVRRDEITIIQLFALFTMTVAIIFWIVTMERAQRRVPILYPERQTENQVLQGAPSHLAFKVNSAEFLPPIIASSLLLLSIAAAQFTSKQGPEWLNILVAQLGRGQWAYMLVYSALIIFIAFLYAATAFDANATADTLRRHGGIVSGIRNGRKSVEYIDYVLTRITALSAAYLALVCVIPQVISSYRVLPFYVSGSSLLIATSVIMKIVEQMQSHLLAAAHRETDDANAAVRRVGQL